MTTPTHVIPSSVEASIRATVASYYRRERRYSNPFNAALNEANGWARLLADEYVDIGTPQPTTALYYRVAREYVAAARRLGARRAAKRQQVAA